MTRPQLAQNAWCPGCGNFPLLKALNEAIDTSGIDRRKLVLVSGIGQAAKTPHYTYANVYNGLHGRAVPAATGIKFANPELEVIITSGDGDMYGEGGNHIMHAMRRNVSIKAFVHDNQIYGLTKGQASPMSEPGLVTKVQTFGVTSVPANPLAMGVIYDIAMVARAFVGDPAHLKETMKEALAVRSGFVLLDILQPCVSFNKLNTYQWYRERVRKIGPDHVPTDRHAALELAQRWGEEIPIGVIYRGSRRSFEELHPVLHG
jgi:2-oxoglutarate ferredoxin oxidoreductase subunit beta